MKEVTLSGGRVAIVDDEDFALVSNHKWRPIPTRSKPPQFRAITTVNKRTVFMHRLILGAIEGQQVDHRNGNPLDNQRKNLRFATALQNSWNKRSKSKHGFKGVAFNDTKPLSAPYFARISDHGKVLHLGYFFTAIEAARAYDAKANELFGEFAALNFPKVKAAEAETV